MSDNTKGMLCGLAAYAIYALHDALVKYLGASYGTFQILFFSMLFGFPLISVMLIRDASAANLRPKHPWWGALRMVTMLSSYICVFYGFTVLPLTQTYAILFSLPLLVTLLSVPLLGENVGLHRGIAVVLGLIGVLIVVQPGSQPLSLGHAAVFVGAFSGALNAIIVRKIGRDERDVVMMLYPMLGMFVVMGGLMPLDYTPMTLFDLGAVAALSVLAIIALNFIVVAYKTGEASVVAPMLYTQIIWASIFGYLFFAELPEPATMYGSGVIILSGLYIVYRESRKGVSENTPVLRTRSRFAAGPALRVSHILRLNKEQDAPVENK